MNRYGIVPQGYIPQKEGLDYGGYGPNCLWTGSKKGSTFLLCPHCSDLTLVCLYVPLYLRPKLGFPSLTLVFLNQII